MTSSQARYAGINSGKEERAARAGGWCLDNPNPPLSELPPFLGITLNPDLMHASGAQNGQEVKGGVGRTTEAIPHWHSSKGDSSVKA